MSSALRIEPGTIDEGLDAGLDDLIHLDWEEIEIEHEKVPLDVRWPEYRRLEKVGVLRPFYAWDKDRLVGYSVFFLNEPLHHGLTKWAINDLIYLLPEYRRGWSGVRLIRQSEAALRELGAKVISYQVKTKGDLGSKHRRGTVGDLLARLGYTRVEEAWAKYL